MSGSLMRVDDDCSHLKVPPHSVEAEIYVLGGLMLDAGSWDKVQSLLVEADFYRQHHRLIFRAISFLFSNDEPVDILTVGEYLKSINELEQAGGLAFVGGLAKDAISVANIKAHAEIVRDHSLRRQVIAVASELISGVYDHLDVSPKSIIEDAEGRFSKLNNRYLFAREGMESIRPITRRVLDDMSELSKNPPEDGVVGTSSGWGDFDKIVPGFQGGDFVVIGGRPSMGKTTFAMNLSEHIAKTKPVIFFSMEMPKDQLSQRVMASLGNVPLDHIRKAWTLTETHWAGLGNAVKTIQDLNLWIDDGEALSISDIRARSRLIVRKLRNQFPDGLGGIVVDYIQLMRPTNENASRNDQIGEISRGFKSLAKELDCPVFALSQLNRELEKRPNKKPRPSDLRDSGSIEQDADIIIFPYRDEVYNPDDEQCKGRAEIIVAKQRNAGLGSANLVFDGAHCKFKSFSPDVYDGRY